MAIYFLWRENTVEISFILFCCIYMTVFLSIFLFNLTFICFIFTRENNPPLLYIFGAMSYLAQMHGVDFFQVILWTDTYLLLVADTII